MTNIKLENNLLAMGIMSLLTITIKACLSISTMLCLLLLSSCSEHSGHNITEFTGDYRYSSGIGEFFNCSDHKRYFVAKSGIAKELGEKFKALALKDNDDAFLRAKGYLKQQTVVDGIDPVTVFVPVEFIAFDKSRGCELAIRKGH